MTLTPSPFPLVWSLCLVAALALVFPTVVAVGALDELHQASLPGRVADARDFLTNVCAGAGAAFALLLLYGADRSRRDTETSPS